MKDVEYVVDNDEIVIVDQFTGRLMKGRAYSDGLHLSLIHISAAGLILPRPVVYAPAPPQSKRGIAVEFDCPSEFLLSIIRRKGILCVTFFCVIFVKIFKFRIPHETRIGGKSVLGIALARIAANKGQRVTG